MIRMLFPLLLIVCLAGLFQPVDARPEFFNRFIDDPLRNTEFSTCATCHINPEGGGNRNEFGQAFQRNNYTITPIFRSEWPDRFQFETAQLPDGTTLYTTDPESRYVVAEKEEEKFLIDIAALAAGATLAAAEDEEPPEPTNSMRFFITSEGPGNGGDLNGLAGADNHCQSLAEAAGGGNKTWRAYLSTSYNGAPAVNAGDRIGSGPWYNARGVLIARGPADLHTGGRLSLEQSLNENGQQINGRGDDPNRHDILTGSLADGTAAVDMNCNNWSRGDEGVAMVGHHDREGGGDNGTSWNSAHASRSCSQEDLQATGGDGLFYCFAID